MNDVKTEDFLNKMDTQALKTYNVQISSDNKYWENYVLIITPSELILSLNEQKKSHFWKTISRFDYNNRKIYISFDETNYIIQSPNITNLISDLCEILQRVLLPSELSNIDFSKLNTPPIGPGTESADSRFKMQQKGNLHSSLSKKEIISLIKYGTPSFRISNAPDVGFLLPAYLDILPFIKTLKIIEFPIIGVDHMKTISNLPLELRYTYKIEINGSVNPILFTFLERARESQKQSKLTSLSFSLANFNRNDLTTISNSIIRGPINSIEFHRSFHPSSVPYFYSTFLSHQINGMLWILNLDKTTALDLNKLFPKVRNIPFLSLAFCELDIIDVLTVASESKLSKLTILNLTGNNALSSSIEKINDIQKILPLKKLIFDKINWPDHFLVQFLTVLFDRFRENLALSFSCAYASNEQWNEFFDFIETVDYGGLIGLSWNFNPVHTNLFHFLNRCGQLRHLEFDFCFSEESSELVRDLANVIKSSPELRDIDVAGSKEKHAWRHIAAVVEACVRHANLRRVNLPFSYGGDEVLPLIVQLIESTPSVKTVNFEGLGLTDHKSFLDTMLKLSKSRGQVKVNFPLDDLLKFKGIISKDDEKELKNAYRRSYTDSPNNEQSESFTIKAAEKSLLNKKRLYYRTKKKGSFPEYISAKTIERLKDELVDVPDQIAEKKKIQSTLSKTVGYVQKKPAGELKINNKKKGTSLSQIRIQSNMALSTKSSQPIVEEEEEENDDQVYSNDDGLNNSQTESEHPFQEEKEVSNYSESLGQKPPQNTKSEDDSIEKLEENGDDDDDESLTQSISSLPNPANHLIRKSSNMPKNLALSDYDSEEIYDHSTFKSPETSKLTISGEYDSLSNSYTIDELEFNPTPIFDKHRDYKFSSDQAVEESSKHDSNFASENSKENSESIENSKENSESIENSKENSESIENLDGIENLDELEKLSENSDDADQNKEKTHKKKKDKIIKKPKQSANQNDKSNQPIKKSKKTANTDYSDYDQPAIEKLELFEEEEEESSSANDRGIPDSLLSEYSSSLIHTGASTPTGGKKRSVVSSKLQNSNEDDQNGFNSDQNKFDYEEDPGESQGSRTNSEVSITDESYRSYDQKGIENDNNAGYTYSGGYYDYDGYSSYTNYSGYSEAGAKYSVINDGSNNSLEIEIMNDHNRSIQVEINSAGFDQSQTPTEIQFPIENKDDSVKARDANKKKGSEKVPKRDKGTQNDQESIEKVQQTVDDADQNDSSEKVSNKQNKASQNDDYNSSEKVPSHVSDNGNEDDNQRYPQTDTRKPKVRVQRPKPIEKPIEQDPHPNSSESSELNFTPHTPNLTLHTKSIFNFYNDGDDEDEEESEDDQIIDHSKAVERGSERKKEVVKKGEIVDHRLPLIGKERDWTFPVHFDMEPDLSEFKKIFKKYSPDVLYDQLSHEKSMQSRSSTPKARK